MGNFLDTMNRWRSILDLDSDDKQEVFSEMIGALEEAETDAAYYRSIVKGTWPNAEEILERSLSNIRKCNNINKSEK